MPTDRPANKVVVLPHDAIRRYGDLLRLGEPVDVELALVETDDVVARIRHVAAYPGGLSFVLVLFSREEDVFEHVEILRFNPRRGGRRERKHFYVTVEYPDGDVVRTPYTGQRSDEPELFLLAADERELEFVVAKPLPASGEITIVFDWEAGGIAGARASLDAAVLTAAAAAARPLFIVADRP